MHSLQLTNARTSFFEHQVRALERQGVECTVMTVPGREGRDDGRSPTDYLRFWPEVLREADDRYDLVHANFGLTAPMALTQRRLPVVTSLWGTDLYGPFGRVSEACAPHCDAVVVMSAGMNEDLERDCDVVPHGIDFDRFEPIPREEAQASIGWDDGAYHVLFPYRPERGVKDYARAARVVSAVDRRRKVPVRLEVVTGVPQAEFPTYVNAADCLLLTSRREGSPNSVKEAMACNVPVVATDVGDVRERLATVEPSAVADTDAGLVDGLERVLTAEQRSNGRDVAAPDLSMERMGERLREVYERVLDERSGRRSVAIDRTVDAPSASR